MLKGVEYTGRLPQTKVALGEESDDKGEDESDD